MDNQIAYTNKYLQGDDNVYNHDSYTERYLDALSCLGEFLPDKDAWREAMVFLQKELIGE